MSNYKFGVFQFQVQDRSVFQNFLELFSDRSKKQSKIQEQEHCSHNRMENRKRIMELEAKRIEIEAEQANLEILNLDLRKEELKIREKELELRKQEMEIRKKGIEIKEKEMTLKRELHLRGNYQN